MSFPPPGDLPDPGIEPESLVSLALAGGFFIIVPHGKPIFHINEIIHYVIFYIFQLE